MRKLVLCTGKVYFDLLAAREASGKTDVAIARVSAAEFVGISELYDESWCLLQFQLSGKLPSECTCDVGSPCTLGLTTQAGTRLADCKGHSTQKRHGVPPHGKASSPTHHDVNQMSHQPHFLRERMRTRAS